MVPAMPSQCKTCIFRPDNPMRLRPGRLGEIQAYLIEGAVHLCHTVEDRACRGGRDFQIQCWHRMGILPEPTDAALAAAMEAHLGHHP